MTQDLDRHNNPLNSPPSPREYNIGLIKGDGIGVEVVDQSLLVLAAVENIFGFKLRFVDFPYSAKLYSQTKQLPPDSFIDELASLEAILLGAIGHPSAPAGFVERAIILAIRQRLNLFANVRPVKLIHPQLTPLKNISNIDFIIVRENIEGLYAQLGGNHLEGSTEEIATTTAIYTYHGVERIIRFGFNLALQRNKIKRVTIVDKSNAIPPEKIWRRIANSIGQDFPGIKLDFLYADVAAMKLVEEPSTFDVIVTSNHLGDILSDLGSTLTGGIGFAPSASIGPKKPSLFEPIHGSAPDIAGQNKANPIGAILSSALMLEQLGETAAAQAINLAVELTVSKILDQAKQPITNFSTTELSKKIIAQLSLISNP